MLDDYPVRSSHGRPIEALPLFYRKRTKANGEIDEVSLGPSVMRVFRWIALVIAAALLAFGPADSSMLLKLLLKLFP
jgi:hypothetical protein